MDLDRVYQQMDKLEARMEKCFEELRADIKAIKEKPDLKWWQQLIPPKEVVLSIMLIISIFNGVHFKPSELLNAYADTETTQVEKADM